MHAEELGILEGNVTTNLYFVLIYFSLSLIGYLHELYPGDSSEYFNSTMFAVELGED